MALPPREPNSGSKGRIPASARKATLPNRQATTGPALPHPAPVGRAPQRSQFAPQMLSTPGRAEMCASLHGCWSRRRQRARSIHGARVPPADSVQQPRSIHPRQTRSWPSSAELGGLIALLPNPKNTTSAPQSRKNRAYSEQYLPGSPPPDAEHERRNAAPWKRLFLVLQSQILGCWEAAIAATCSGELGEGRAMQDKLQSYSQANRYSEQSATSVTPTVSPIGSTGATERPVPVTQRCTGRAGQAPSSTRIGPRARTNSRRNQYSSVAQPSLAQEAPAPAQG